MKDYEPRENVPNEWCSLLLANGPWSSSLRGTVGGQRHLSGLLVVPWVVLMTEFWPTFFPGSPLFALMFIGGSRLLWTSSPPGFLPGLPPSVGSSCEAGGFVAASALTALCWIRDYPVHT